MNLKPNSGLARFYQFFDKYGTERLDGLDESYFQSLTQNEREEAWNFLKKGVPSSYEHIKGLCILDRARAIPLFKEALENSFEPSSSPTEREQLQQSRLLMLDYVLGSQLEKKYIDALTEFANSEFPDIRAGFAQSLPINAVTPESEHALKKMIFTETETIPRTSAIKKLMRIYGLKFKLKDPIYDSIYLALRSDDPKVKLTAMAQLSSLGQPSYLQA